MPGKRERCDGCGELVSMRVDYWPRGQGKPPRKKLCLHCWTDLGQSAVNQIEIGAQ